MATSDLHVTELRHQLPEVFEPKGPLGDYPWPIYDPQTSDRIEIDVDDFASPDRFADVMSEEALHGEPAEVEEGISEASTLLPRRRDLPQGGPWQPGDPGEPRRSGASDAETEYGPPPPFDSEAWYQPFHFFPHDWGIFIADRAVERVTSEICRQARTEKGGALTPQERSEAARAAVLIFYGHEFYHHQLECFATRMEVHLRQRGYVPQFREPHWLREEALANASAYLKLASSKLPRLIVKAAQRYLRVVFPASPPGYRDAVHFLTSASFKRGEYALQESVHRSAGGFPKGISDSIWKVAPHAMRGFGNRSSRIYFVVDRAGRRDRPVLFWSWSFSTPDLVLVAQKVGAHVVEGGKGSHVKVKTRDGRMIVIPGDRKDIAKGTAASVLRGLGVRPAEAAALLRA